MTRIHGQVSYNSTGVPVGYTRGGFTVGYRFRVIFTQVRRFRVLCLGKCFGGCFLMVGFLKIFVGVFVFLGII